MNYVKGIYKKSIFKSDKGYIIGLLKLEETDSEVMKDYIGKTITFTGYFSILDEGDSYTFRGEEKDHPRYGLQFNVTSFEKMKPTDKDGVIAFLASDLFPQIGKKIATSIVETLGDTALDQILDNPSCLELVPKLTKKKADIIYSVLEKYDESHRMIVYLTELGFSIKDSLSIYNYYLKNTMSVIEANIFKLVDDIEDISFTKVDQISKVFSFEKLDIRRIKACIIYIMKNLTFSKGDTYLIYDDIYNGVCSYVEELIDTTDFDNYLKELIIEQKIVKENQVYYLKDMYETTNYIVNKFRILLSRKKGKIPNIDSFIKELEKNIGIKYNDKQKEAIESSLIENVLIITGGPGTGKTTIIKAITELYSASSQLSYEKLITHLALLAPTGRAAKRLSEATNLPATTIHRFLKWNKETNKFSINEHDKSEAKFVIVDEVSMIDENLMSNLLKGLTDNIKLILVGDYNQLPSVGPGQILKDLIESEAIKTIELDYLYRQDENSYINTLAYEVKNNSLSPDFLDKKEDYMFLECKDFSIKENLKNLCLKVVDKNYDYKKFQIMAPMYRGENGIDNLNRELQKIFNPPSEDKDEIKVGEVIYRTGDKVIQLVNMPDENIYNGDIGIIYKIINKQNDQSEIQVEYDYGIVIYTVKDFAKIKHAFIISIHKSQGSEFDLVMMPISNAYNRMLYRKLIYTGITRAKKKLVLIGNPDAFLKAIQNNEELMRNTTLKEKMIIMNNYLKC